MFIANGLNILLFLTVWRLAWHWVASHSNNSMIQSLAKAAFVQAG